jgi:hypothetical protein
MPSRAQKVADSLFAKYIRIALAIFRKFDDSFGYAVAGIKTAPVSLNSLTASRAISNATPMIRVVSRSNLWSPRNCVIGMIPIRSLFHQKENAKAAFVNYAPITAPTADSIRVKFIPGESGCSWEGVQANCAMHRPRSVRASDQARIPTKKVASLYDRYSRCLSSGAVRVKGSSKRPVPPLSNDGSGACHHAL